MECMVHEQDVRNEKEILCTLLYHCNTPFSFGPGLNKIKKANKLILKSELQ